nr:glycosyltransferase family 1 protein [Chitinophagaceae bacterium]
VASDVSGNQDLLEQNISGLLVPVANVEKLAVALIEMLQYPERAIAMGAQAYESVKEKCDIVKVAQKYIALYHQILPKN